MASGTLVAPRDRLGRLEAGLILDTVARHAGVVLVSGDNRLDAYGLLAAARTRGMEEAVAQGTLVVRAFTVHQLAALLARDLPRFVAGRRPGLVLVAGFLDLFLDEDVRPAEARRLLDRLVRSLRALEAPLVVTYAPPSGALERGLARLVETAFPERVPVERVPQTLLESFASAAAEAA